MSWICTEKNDVADCRTSHINTMIDTSRLPSSFTAWIGVYIARAVTVVYEGKRQSKPPGAAIFKCPFEIKFYRKFAACICCKSNLKFTDSNEINSNMILFFVHKMNLFFSPIFRPCFFLVKV